MGMKNTKIWLFAKKLKNNYHKYKHYNRTRKLPLNEYEKYLVRRYSEMMNRRKYSYGRKLSFDNPKTFTEISQWLKLYDQDERKNRLADKISVRDFVKKKIGEEYLIPLINIEGKYYFENAKEIDFSKLPSKFVLKCNHGSHMNIVVKNKNLLSKKDIKIIKQKLNKWLKIDYTFYVSLETQYSKIKHYIYIEQYITFPTPARDYKFMCFHGKCHYFWINENCLDEKRETCTTFDSDLKIAPFNMNVGFRKDISDKSLPPNIKEMIKIAEILALDFIFVRVDLYNNNGQILFGELTFNSAAGYDAPYPIEYDLELGKLMQIDQSKRKGNYTYRKK